MHIRYLKKEVLKKILRYSCLAKYQKRFYRFVFIFYKAENNAIIYKYMFDAEIDEEIEDSLKLYSY